MLGQQQNNTVRSFNLLRLKAIEEQRNQTLFDSEQAKKADETDTANTGAGTTDEDFLLKRRCGQRWGASDNRGRAIRIISPSKVHLSLKTIIYQEDENLWRYSEDMSDLDGYADDADDLLSMSMFEIDPPSSTGSVAASERHSWTPSVPSTYSHRAHTPLKVHLKGGHHSREYRHEGRFSSSRGGTPRTGPHRAGRRPREGGAGGQVPDLSIQGEQCFGGMQKTRYE